MKKGFSNSTAIGSCEIKNIFLVNHKGEHKDILNLVRSLSLTESLYNPFVTLKIGVVDESNLFEFFEMNGNEKIVMNIRQKPNLDNAEDYTTDIIYRVTDYPRYSRGDEGQSQTYIINAVSEIAYLSSLKLISRGFDGPIAKEIEKIITTDLKQETLKIRGNPTTSYAGVFEWAKPLQQALEFTNTLTDTNNSPFYLWQNIHDLVQLRSYSDIISDESNFYRTFLEKRRIRSSGDPRDPVTQVEEAVTLRNLKSFLGLNRPSAGANGAYASENFSFDISNRIYTNEVFSYTKANRKYLTGKTNHYDNFSPLSDKKSFDDSPDMSKNYSYRNSFSFDGSENSGEAERFTAGELDSYIQNIDTISHEITVAGDLFLNPGKIVSLEIPKATDPKNLRSYIGDDAEVLDLVFSRRYMVTTSIHTIDLVSGNYQTVSKIVTDSIKVL